MMLISAVADLLRLHLFLKMHVICGLDTGELQLTVVIAV